MLGRLWDDIRAWRWATGVFATLAFALLVAAIISRDAPDFSELSIVAVVRDGERHPVWAVRLARTAHQIAADSLRDLARPTGARLPAVAVGSRPDRTATDRIVAVIRAQAHRRLARKCTPVGRCR